MNMETKIFDESNCLSEKQIIDYCSKKTSDEKLHKIELHLIYCPLCSDAVDGAKMFDTNLLKDDISYLHKNGINNTSHFRKYYLAYSSVAAIMLIAITALLNFSNQSNSLKLFNKYFEVYPDVTIHTRSNGDDSILADAMLLYNSGKFDATIEKLKQVKTGTNEHVDFYKGVSLLAINKPLEASKVLFSLTENQQSEFYNEANWFTALAYLALDKNKQAISHFDKLKESYDYSDRVNNILLEITTNE